MKYEVKSWHEVVDTETGLAVTGRKHLEEAQEIADLLNAEGKRVADALNDEAARVETTLRAASLDDVDPASFSTITHEYLDLYERKPNGQDKETT